jgi:Ca-activated chloride channel family protein
MNEVFEKEWKLYCENGDKAPFEAEKPKADGEFDKDVKVGEIRIFADMKRPFVALIAESRGAAGWLIVPVSPFTVPASKREMLVGERVFQLWNATTAAKSFVARSWIVDTLDEQDVADIRGAIPAANPGRVRDGENAVAQYERAFLVAGGTFVPLVRPRAAASGRIIFFRCLRAAAALVVCGGVAWSASRIANERRSARVGVAYEMREVVDKDEDIAAAVREAEERAAAEAAPRKEALRRYEPESVRSESHEVIAAKPASIHAKAVVKSPVTLRGTFGSVQGMHCDMAAEADTSYAHPAYARDRLPHAVPEAERYAEFTENEFLDPKSSPLSTFSLDVDTTSYALMRRAIADQKRLPPPTSVRIEEYVNYFHYDYPEPKGDDPIAVDCEMAPCPWNANHKLARIGLQAKRLAKDKIPPCNLTFLIDVSGSMSWHGGIGMVKKGLSMLVGELRDEDRVAIVTYANGTEVRLPSTPGTEKKRILEVIDSLMAGGGTAGGAGIQLAYEEAKKNFDKARNNRVILVTDGDFNIGISSPKELEDFIAEKRDTGVFLTVLGVGEGNYQDRTMKKLANAGNGNYAFIDSVLEAKKVFMDEFGGTLQTVAKDVKLQIEFNPAKVSGYRLLGYENRQLAAKDFNDDKKDAGEIGAGHTMTALYEIVPAGAEEKVADVDPLVDPLKYQKTESVASEESFTVKLRWKKPDGDTSILRETPCTEAAITRKEPSESFRFASAVSEFALLLENSKFKGDASFDDVLKRARGAKGKDNEGYRAEFIRLVEAAQLYLKI